MAKERVQRRLAAVIAADVVGYSRLMGKDEEGTLARLKKLRAEFLHPKVAEYGGRIVKTTGDGTLIEFGSAVAAVSHAIDVQRGLSEQNAELPDSEQIHFRLGINVGDIIIEDDDIYGDGVNIAARLESLAEPGSICISHSIYRHIKNKAELEFIDMGPQQFKNISQPVRAYRIIVNDKAQGLQTSDSNRVLTLPDKPSIAVLPFENMSGDPEQEYFSDGIAEDIITALSRFRFLNARNSSFTHKGRTVDVRTLGQELDVRYVLEGSVRKGPDRLRITAQLIEAKTGNHLWAERYDGALEDVFDLQDGITEGVVAAIEPSVRQAEIERAKRKRPESLDAYDLYLQALPHAWVWTPAEAKKALGLLDEALRFDTKYVAAHGLSAFCNAILLTDKPDDIRRSKALQHVHAVLGPDTDDSIALALAAVTLALLECDYDTALDATNRAMAFTPNFPIVLTFSAVVHAYAGFFETAIYHSEESLRLSPFDPVRFAAEVASAYSHFFMDHYDIAAEAAQRSVHINPKFLPGFAILAASRANNGQNELAHAAVRHLLALKPEFRIEEFIGIGRFATILNNKYAAALRRAGLPE